MNRFILAAIALLMPTVAGAQPVPAPQPTVQAQFDAASEALRAHDWAQALQLLEAIEARAHDPRTLAIVRVRRANALTGLGRYDEAGALLRAELPHLPADDRSLDDDRFTALVSLAQAAERRLDYDEALGEYRLADAIPLPEIEKLPVRRGIVQTLLFSDPEAALREAERALAGVAADAPDNHALEGAVQTLKGRALLNLGRYQEARTTLTQAMRQLGGLTLRVDRADLVARSDLALAALLSGATDLARHYLAYTGAGRFSRGYLKLSGTAHLPHCGGDLVPADVAVIEAVVADDGRVVSAVPIYASRRGGSALAFARAVADWSFEPESAVAIPALFRGVARFEVRCSQTPHDDGYAESINAIPDRMAARDPAWRTALDRLRHLPLPQLRQELAAGGTSTQALLPELVTVGLSEAAPAPERQAAFRRAVTLAAGLPDPAALLASLALGLASVSTFEPGTPGPEVRNLVFDTLLALPEIGASPRAALEIRLARARYAFRDNEDERALAAAATIRYFSGLAANDPLKFQAMEVIAALRAAEGSPAAARAVHDAMGPTAARCNPLTRRTRIIASDEDFPRTALQWGFEGWATGEVAIGANGVPRTVRTLVAYPAFVFSEAEEVIVRTSRFDPVFIPDDGTCPGPRQSVRFLLPGD